MFQAEVELLQSVEGQLKEDVTSLQSRNAQLETEKKDIIAKLDVGMGSHEAHVREMNSKLEALTVSKNSLT